MAKSRVLGWGALGFTVMCAFISDMQEGLWAQCKIDHDDDLRDNLVSNRD